MNEPKVNIDAVTDFTDPFQLDNIKGVWMNANEYSNFKWKGYIEFKNGKTEGKQNFGPFDNISDLTQAMKIFIDSLKTDKL